MSQAQRTARTLPAPNSERRTVMAAMPLTLALFAIAAVWVAGCIWSFREQAEFAAAKGFTEPWLLPLILDGLAIAMAGVAYAASLDGRAAVLPRLGTALAVIASATSNAAWAWERSDGDVATVTLGAGVPIVANVAFEVLLSEVRRQVMRRRGLQAPVPIPTPRLLRVLMAPLSTLREWRAVILELTALNPNAAPIPSPPIDAAGNTQPPEQLLVLDDYLHDIESGPADVALPADPAPLDLPSPVPVAAALRETADVAVIAPRSRTSANTNTTSRPEIRVAIEQRPTERPTKEAAAKAFYLRECSAGQEPTTRAIAEAAEVSEGRVRAWRPAWRRELELEPALAAD